MATIQLRKDRPKPYRVQIRLANHPAESQSFLTKKEAQEWAKKREGELTALEPKAPSGSYDPTLQEIVDKYDPECKGFKSYKTFYTHAFNRLRRHHIRKLKASRLTLKHLEQFKKHMRRTGASDCTVKRYFYTYRAMLRTAKEVWKAPISLDTNKGSSKIGHKAKEKERVVRFEPIDIETIVADIWKRDKRCPEEQKQLYEDCFRFVLDVGVRQSELLAIEPSHYSRHFKTIHLFDTKNGEDRIVGLSPLAISIIERRVALKTRKIFPVKLYALRSMFRRIFDRNGYKGLKRWHDTRHEALSAYFEKGLGLPEVRNQSGHKSIASLNRYVHAKVSNIVSKLEANHYKETRQ